MIASLILAYVRNTFHVCAFRNIQTYVTQPTNSHIQYVLSHIINYQHVLIASAVILRLALKDY